MYALTATCKRCQATVPLNVTAADAKGVTCNCCGRFARGTDGDGACPECAAAAQEQHYVEHPEARPALTYGDYGVVDAAEHAELVRQAEADRQTERQAARERAAQLAHLFDPRR